MLWSDYVTTIADLLHESAIITDAASAAPSSVPDFNNALPRSIEYVENRMQRELDLLATYVTDESGAFTANSRKFTFPTDKGIYRVVTQIYPFLNGVRQPPLMPVSLEFLNAAYPSDTPLTPGPSVPLYFAPNDDQTVIVGPAPDSAYTAGVVGTQRLVPLSSTATSNFLTTSLPDAYIAAAMVWWAGQYERDYGTQANDPQLPATWETAYKTLMGPALVEEARKKFQAQGWSPRLPSPVATPPQR